MRTGARQPTTFTAWTYMLLAVATLVSSAAPPPIYRFVPNKGVRWHESFCLGVAICKIGDFNGDRKSDILAFVRDSVAGKHAGDVLVALSDGTQFLPPTYPPIWEQAFCTGTEVCDVGDFDGNGKDDIIFFKRSSTSDDTRGDVVVALSDGTKFEPPKIWHDFFCISTEQCAVGDFNGDNKDDLILFKRGSAGDVLVALSDGTRFEPATVWNDSFCTGTEVCAVGDFNGDNKDDIVFFTRDSATGAARGNVQVALSNGTTFGPATIWNDRFCVGTEMCDVGDFNGDNKADIILFKRDSATGAARGDVVVALSDGERFQVQPLMPLWHDFFCIHQEVCEVGDVDGDLKDDIIAFVRSSDTSQEEGDVRVALGRQVSLNFLPTVAVR